MIGIDIVDLHDQLLKERTAKDLRFISSPEEKLNLSEFSSLHYWMIWSAKEAVFKSIRKLESFDPKSISLVIHENTMSFYSRDIQGRWILDENHILALAWQDHQPDHHIHYSESNDPSREIREKVIDFFATKGRKVVVSSDHDRLPILIDVVAGIQVPLSLSHHGKWFAYGIPASF